MIALTWYRGDGRALVSSYKFAGRRLLVPRLADALVERVGTSPPIDTVTWIPTTPAHRRARGFDQAELLGRAVGRRLGCGVGRLERIGRRTQTGRSRRERHLDGLQFRTVGRGWGPNVLVIDDVVTTGATLGAAARTLRATGVRHVRAAVVAQTP